MRFMARTAPCSSTRSTASAAVSQAASSSRRSSASTTSASTWSAVSTPAGGRPTPTFTRRNSGLPSASMIDSTPWLPPSPPPRRSFTRPGVTSTSSWIRMRSASPTPRLRHSRATASPESFMKVCGLARSTVSSPRRPSPIRARSAARSTAIPQRPASRSTTAKPALCRLPSYRVPGLPRPTTIRTRSAFPGLRGWSLRGRSLRRRGRGSLGGGSPLRRGLGHLHGLRLHGRRDHRDDGPRRVADDLDALGEPDVGQVDGLVDAERADVDLDELGNLRGQALDLELAQDRLQDAAGDHTLGLADEVQRDGYGESLRQVDLVEVGVQHATGHGMPLHLAQEHHALVQLRVGSAGMEEPDQVGALEMHDTCLELLRVDGDAGCGALRTVEHGGHLPSGTQPAHRALPRRRATLDVDLHGLHDDSLR